MTKIGIDRSPSEAGGIILVDEDLKPELWVIELPNISDHPEDSCLFDMPSMEECHRDRLMRVDDPADVWLWHTHPGGNVGPSRMDMRNRIPGVSYFVVAIPSGVGTRY